MYRGLFVMYRTLDEQIGLFCGYTGLIYMSVGSFNHYVLDLEIGCKYICMYLYIHINTYISEYKYMNICVYTYVYTCIYENIYICIYLYM